MRRRIPDRSPGNDVVAPDSGEHSRGAARLLVAALWVASLVVTFQLGSGRGARRSSPVPAPGAAGEAAPASDATGLPLASRAFGEGDVRRWIVEAVRAEAEASRVLGRGADPPPPASAPTSATPERGTSPGASAEPDFDPVFAEATFNRGEQLLRVARERGTWTLDDAMVLRGMMPQLPAAERHALADALFAALGEGRLRSELPGPPL